MFLPNVCSHDRINFLEGCRNVYTYFSFIFPQITLYLQNFIKKNIKGNLEQISHAPQTFLGISFFCSDALIY